MHPLTGSAAAPGGGARAGPGPGTNAYRQGQGRVGNANVNAIANVTPHATGVTATDVLKTDAHSVAGAGSPASAGGAGRASLGIGRARVPPTAALAIGSLAEDDDSQDEDEDEDVEMEDVRASAKKDARARPDMSPVNLMARPRTPSGSGGPGRTPSGGRGRGRGRGGRVPSGPSPGSGGLLRFGFTRTPASAGESPGSAGRGPQLPPATPVTPTPNADGHASVRTGAAGYVLPAHSPLPVHPIASLTPSGSGSTATSAPVSTQQPPPRTPDTTRPGPGQQGQGHGQGQAPAPPPAFTSTPSAVSVSASPRARRAPTVISISSSVSPSPSPEPIPAPAAPAPTSAPAPPSPSRSAPIINLASRSDSPLTPAAPSPAPEPEPKGKRRTAAPAAGATPAVTATGAETSRRVLPARIRRAAGAGAGAESVRELEEMIVDWLERYGDVDAEPPESLPIVVTTLPLALLSPQPFCVHSQHAEDIIVKVEVEVPDPLAPTAAPAKEAAALIETPSWVLVTAGQDDQMEAREEMSAGPTRSPTKRLRHGVAGSQLMEDTSDAYYESVHRKMEAFERRQRIREIDKLKFMRHKMNSRIDLLRNLPLAQWNAVVHNVLARGEANEAWARGRRRLEAIGVDWLRRQLIREGIELLTRYDQLLPGAHDQKKQRLLDASHNSSPSVASSASPPPTRSAGTPAPDEEPPLKRGRPRKSLPSQETTSSSRRQSYQAPVRTPAAVPPQAPSSAPAPVRRYGRRNKQAAAPSPSPASSLSELDPTPPPPERVPKLSIRLIAPVTPKPQPSPSTKEDTEQASKPASTRGRRASAAKEPSTPSLPALLEAAKRREKEKPVQSRSIRETRRSVAAREADAASDPAPFGVPLPTNVESKADFSLGAMEGFRSLVAARAVSASPKKAPVLPMTATVVTPSTANNGHAQPPRPASALSSQPAPKLWVSPLGTAPVMAAPLAPSAQAPQRTSPPESTEEDEMEGVEACVLTVDTSIDSNDSY